MTDQTTAALRVMSTEQTAPDVVAPTHIPGDATEETERRATIPASPRPGEAMSPIRRWRGAPRPTSWQPGTWRDAL
jgi:hypothetical protein